MVAVAPSGLAGRLSASGDSRLIVAESPAFSRGLLVDGFALFFVGTLESVLGAVGFKASFEAPVFLVSVNSLFPLMEVGLLVHCGHLQLVQGTDTFLHLHLLVLHLDCVLQLQQRPSV